MSNKDIMKRANSYSQELNSAQQKSNKKIKSNFKI